MKRKTFSIAIFLTLVMTAFAIVPLNVSAATTWYVDDDNCPGPGSGTAGDPYCKIQDAIDAAVTGDTIIVADGTYITTSAINVNKGVTITGNIANPENVLVKYNPASSTLNCVEVNSADVTIQGIKVQDCKNGFYFDRNVNTNTGVTISNCIIESVSGWGIGEISSPNTVISHNTITNAGDKGIYIRKCVGTSESNRCEAISNVISGCGQPAIQVYKSPYTVVSGNTISSTSDKGIFIWGPNANSVTERVEVTNNIISGCPWTAILVIYDRYTYIHGNNVGSTGDKGIAIGDGENINNVNERIEVSDNTITETKWPGIQVAYSVPYTYIYGNTLTGCNYYGGDGTGDWDYASIHVDENCPSTVIDSNTVSDGINGIQTWSNDVTITNNEIYDMGKTYADEKVVGGRTYKNSGILVGSNWGSGDIDPTGIVIENNNIHDNYWGLFYSADLTNGVTAEYNYWGHASGPHHPTTNPAALGDDVSANVDYSPWLGFTVGTSPMTYYTNDNIQDAIDAAIPGDTVLVADGDYYDDVNVNVQGITVQAMNPPTSTAIIYGTVDITANGVTFENFKVMPTATYTTDEAAIAVYASDVTVNGNIVDGMTGDGTGTVKGIFIYAGSMPGISNIAITNNIIKNINNLLVTPYGGSDGIMVQGVVDGVNIIGNTIEDIHSAGWAYGIEVTPTGSAPLNPPQNVVIEENQIDSIGATTYPGVCLSIDAYFDGSTYYPADATEVTVHCNSFENTPYGAINKDIGQILNAEHNWWGDASGPYDPSDDTATGGLYNPDGLGAAVSDYVDFDPWATSTPPCQEPGPVGGMIVPIDKLALLTPYFAIIVLAIIGLLGVAFIYYKRR